MAALLLPAPAANAMAPTLAPIAFVKFCLRYPAECAPRGGRAWQPLPWTAALSAQLQTVNAAVNAAIVPRPKQRGARLDWSLNPPRGDCNDFAVTKRHRLLAAGFSSDLLMLAVVMTPWDEPHLVLLVRTDHGDIVLDNLDTSIRPLSETGYRLVARQSNHDPHVWVS